MRFTTTVITAILALTVTALPQAPAPAQNVPDAAAIAALVPDFGVKPGVKTGLVNPGIDDCFTPVKPVPIPCACPPPMDKYLPQLVAAVQAGKTFGKPAPFPTGSDLDSKNARLGTMNAVLQSINGTLGTGCPAISNTWQQTVLA